MSDPNVYRRLAELERRLEALSTTDRPVIGTGTAGRIAQWATGGQSLESSTLIKAGAGVLTLSSAATQTVAFAGGTFSPTFQGSTIAGTFTYTAQRGVWRQVGDAVFVMAQAAISAITVAPTGNMRIAGLPFAVATAVAGNGFGFSIDLLSNVDYPAGALELTAIASAGNSFVDLFYTRDNLATLSYPAASFTNAAANILVSGWYVGSV
jgi:hypothetical protein